MRVEKTDEYRDWIDGLKDLVGRARVLMRVDRRWRQVDPSHGHRQGTGTQPKLRGAVVMTKLAANKPKPAQTKTSEYDVSEHLRTPEEMAAYLDAWLDEAPEDAAGIARALGDIARAKGMSQVAKDAGLSRESLYRALSAEGNPSFATVLKVARALGVRLHAQAAPSGA